MWLYELWFRMTGKHKGTTLGLFLPESSQNTEVMYCDITVAVTSLHDSFFLVLLLSCLCHVTWSLFDPKLYSACDYITSATLEAAFPSNLLCLLRAGTTEYSILGLTFLRSWRVNVSLTSALTWVLLLRVPERWLLVRTVLGVADRQLLSIFSCGEQRGAQRKRARGNEHSCLSL